MNLQEVEKYYENKFSEKIVIINAKQRDSRNIDILETEIKKETIEKEGYTLTAPVRKRSLFDNKCKYCNNGCVKDNDRFYFSKYGACTNCSIIHEEK